MSLQLSGQHSGQLPAAIEAWCVENVGEPVRLVFQTSRMSEVWGVELTDDRRVVIKARPDPSGRVPSILEAQQLLALRGFPCPLPMTDASSLGGWGAVHAEAWLEAGEIATDDGVETAARFGALLARQVELCRDLRLNPPLPNPPWVCWDHDGPELWPAGSLDADQRPVRELAPGVVEATTRARARLTREPQPAASFVLGHVDWETQHVRWEADVAVVVHDWDSLAWLPEAMLAGVGSGTFASNDIPTLAPFASSAAFLDAYQEERGRPFSSAELELAWAAPLFTAGHNARMEAAYGREPVAERAVLAQCDERLARAGA